MWWTEKRQSHAVERLTEFIREMALLWTVFTVLDRVVTEQLTLQWAVVNGGVGLAGWLIAVYIEVKRIRE
jgi:hypothetical protein